MNRKIKNYVDVLFNDVPQTRKAAELKEEILSTLNDHFEAHIAEGKSENQAYTEALAEMGNIDELLSSIAPEQELKPKIDEYRKRAAKNRSIAVMLFVLGAIFITCIPAVASVFNLGDEDKFAVVGLFLLLVCVGIAVGILTYTNNSVPQDIEPFLVKKQAKFKEESQTPFWQSFWKLYWLVVTIIYLAVSFATMCWHITWIIWLIAAAVKQAIFLFTGQKDEDEEYGEK